MSVEAAERSPYRAALEAQDPAALAEACAPDVVFHSPITSQIRFEGRDELAELFRNVLEVYDDFRFVDEFGTGDTRTVNLHARIGRQELDEVQIVRLDDSGKVREITMFVRPLPGLTTLLAGIGPRLARQRSGWRALAVSAMSRPLAAMTRAGDKPGARLVKR